MKKAFFLILILGINVSLSFGQDIDLTHKSRRLELSKALDSSVVIISSEVKQHDSYKDNKNFYYLTGIQVPNSLLILTPSLDDKDLLITGSKRLDDEFLNNFEIVKKTDLPNTIFKLSRDYNIIATSFLGIEILSEWNINLDIFDEIVKADFALGEMRMIKENQEIRDLKKAINITSDALNEVFKYTKPGLTEKALRSVIRYKFESNDAKEVFIQVASGPNCTSIHFGATERILNENDLIVFDVGVYYNNYTSDISRTIPVNGKFSPSQADIYKIVLEAQKKGIELTRQGNNYIDVQNAITEVLNDGLYNLKLITDKNSEWQKKLYIMHGWGHFIGLDVHDVSKYALKKKDKTYKEGMVITVEPGLYFPEDYLYSIPHKIKDLVTEEEFKQYRKTVLPIYKKYENSGVRIEDDVLITFDGNIVLSKGVPKEINHIEKMMEEGSFFNNETKD
ncbi:MAG: aminopeptidase P N-terminal domain-containing protein [Bacteroidales bacterium]|jgi:Xaa-Pro aminopeptidase|nr:aminopeptidase P N-terminal domain-containing protein [Bacteroidales bacterium]